jgi:DNA-binding winged helix-turn-helix (wHTH) protein/TolB-like protein/tetratricopeptide (TPR) repeat protein
MLNKARHLYDFGPFRFNTCERQLTRDGTDVCLTPRVLDLLQILVENQGRLLEKEEILNSVWPDSHVEEANLTVNMSILRKALGESPGEKYIETIPKHGYRFVADVRIAEPANVIPTGGNPIPLLPEVDAAPSPARKSRRVAILVALGGVVAVAAVATLAYRGFPVNRGAQRIAVLPFRNLSGQSADDYLGAGIAETLAAKLSKMHEILVPSVSSVRAAAESQANMTSLARSLQADALLTGSIQRMQDKLRITVQVLRGRDGSVLWAENFDGEFQNVFSFEDTIAQSVLVALDVHATDSEHASLRKSETKNPDAYALYMQGLFSASHRNGADHERAIEFFSGAAKADPGYALPHAMISFEATNLAGTGKQPDRWEQARREAKEAIRLDPELAEGYLASGQVMMRADWDWDGAEKAFQRALMLNPNLAAAHSAWSTLLTSRARHQQAISEMEEAVRIDPGSAPNRADLAWTYYCARRFQPAIENSRKALALDFKSSITHREFAKQLTAVHSFEEARHEYEQVALVGGAAHGGSVADLGMILAASGRIEEARKIYESLKNQDRRNISNYEYSMAGLAAAIGSNDEAVAWLNHAVELRTARAIWIRVDPEMDPLRTDSRFDQIVKRARLR